MATINLRESRQVIDYLARDYQSFRQALLELIPSKLPEWTDRSEADFGIVLLELFAYVADVLSYYQDRIANEAFLTTAQERRSAIHHLRLIGYEMGPAAAASARLSLIVGNAVTQPLEVRKGDQFATKSGKEGKPVLFEYADEKALVIDPLTHPSLPARDANGVALPGFKELENAIPVREGRTIVNEPIGISDGSPDQRHSLGQPRLLRGSLEIRVEGSPRPWRLRQALIQSERAFSLEQLAALELQGRLGSTLGFSVEADEDYAIETDESDVTTVLFGDGQYGKIPPPGSRILATYRVGGGLAGNVGAGQIVQVARAPQLQLLGVKVVNRRAASGGAERESIERAIRFAPTVFGSMQRAVTAQDYVAQARLFPGVAKARAEATNWNTVRLYVAPAGTGEPPSDVLKRDLLAFFEDRRMLSTLVEIARPDYVGVDVTAHVVGSPFFSEDTVRASTTEAIRDLLAFDNVDFRQRLYLSKVYEAIERLESIDSVFVARFERTSVSNALPPDGVIQMGENEIPVLGALLVVLKQGA